MCKPNKLVRHVERRGRNHARGREDADEPPVGVGRESFPREDAAKDGASLAMRDAGRMATTRHRGPRWAVIQSSLECGVESMMFSARRLWSRRRRGRRRWTGRQTDVSDARRTDEDKDVLKLRRHRADNNRAFGAAVRWLLRSSTFAPALSWSRQLLSAKRAVVCEYPCVRRIAVCVFSDADSQFLTAGATFARIS